MKKLILTAALVAVTCAYGQEEETEASAESEAKEGAIVAKPSERAFFTLPMCRQLEGKGEVIKPGQQAEPIEEGRFYPLGSTFRSVGAGSKLVIQFGPETKDKPCRVTLKDDAAFGTLLQVLGVASRTIELKGGRIKVSLARNLPEGLFNVTAPGFSAVNLTGDSIYDYAALGDGDTATIGCATGGLMLKGRHFEIGPMNTSDQVVIRTSADNLATCIIGKAGDYNVKLDTGLSMEFDTETNGEKVKPTFTNWKMSPLTAVRIFRMVPAVGENMGVTILTFDANGEKKDRYWFAEKHYEVTGAELPPKSDEDAEALAKKAAEAAETTTVEADLSSETSGSGDAASAESGDAAADTGSAKPAESAPAAEDELDF